ncbi:hypothetical protein KF913_18195 [Candidatus Obscuribacterales bacterium]|nr:hypothetical protein [Candidatus Obscuribacterales bacterium]
MKSGSGKKSVESMLHQDWRAAVTRTSILLCGTLLLSSAQTAIAAPNDRPSMREFREIHTDLSRREARELFKDTYNARSATGASLPPRLELKQQRLEAAIIRHAELQNNDVIRRGLQAKLDRIGVQQIGSSLVRLNSGVDLDLTSADRNIVLGSNLFSTIRSSIDITVGGQTQTYTSGSKVTAAEYVAIKQALSGGGQKLLIDASGIASGGTLDLTSITGNNDPMRAANLTVASGVTTYGDFGKNSNFVLKGDLNNYGSIYAVSSTNSARGGAIRADDITNQSGALISSVLPSNLSSANYASKVDLTLAARGELSNYGTIESSGNLTLVSQSVPTIASTSTPVASKLTNTGTISAQDSVFITANTINNTGTIEAVNGSVSVNGSPTLAINVNNTNGTIAALNGAINVRNADYKGMFNNNITGGDLLSKEVNLFAGNATNEVSVNELTGTVSQTGLAGHVSAATADLKIGTTCLTGDPTYYNTAGNISITGDLVVGEALTLIASGSIFSTNGTRIEASSASQGFDITMIAGANITSPVSGGGSTVPTGGVTGPVTFDGASTNGGSILLGTSTIISSPTGTTGNGGNINLFAFKGSVGGVTSGRIDANAATLISSGAGSGTNGNVTIVGGGTEPTVGQGGGTAIQLGAINSSGGTGGGGSLTVATAQPQIVGGATVIYNANGTLDNTGGHLEASSALTTGASIGFSGGIARVGNDVLLKAGKDVVQTLDAPLYTMDPFADVQLVAEAGNVGANPVNAFVINGFNKIFTKSVLKKNDPGNSTLSVDAGNQAFIIRYATTNLTLNQSSADNGLQLQTRSKLTVAGDVTSTNGYVRLQNNGGNLAAADGITVSAADFIDLTNASKNNLKATFTVGANSTFTADTNGAAGLSGNVGMTLDQKAFRLDAPKEPKPPKTKSVSRLISIQRVAPSPTIQSNLPYTGITTGFGIQVNLSNDGEARQYGKGQVVFNTPDNTINADGAIVSLTNTSKAPITFNGNVTINATK